MSPTPGQEHELALEFEANGVDATSGRPLVPALDAEALAKAMRGEALDEEDLARVRERLSKKPAKDSLGTAAGIDPDDLSQAGWAIVIAADEPRRGDIKHALRDLLERRKDEAGDHFREYTYEKGWRAHDFLTKNGTGYDPATPEGGKVPYYVLLIGDPERIPFSFQAQLDRMYAVGRLSFDDIDGFRRYARAVDDAETKKVTKPRMATFFGTQNAADKATALSHKYLVSPLAARVAADHPSWTCRTLLAAQATKDNLRASLRRTADARGPAFLFTASHGVGFPKDHQRQRTEQGALLCQDWPGPITGAGREITADMLFGAGDVGGLDLAGSIAFFFACYSAGTPHRDTFAESAQAANTIASKPLVSALPTALLSHADGAALAVIGHVDRAWPASFKWGAVRDQHEAMRSVITELLSRKRVGAAMEHLGQRAMQLASALADERAAAGEPGARPTVEAALALGAADAAGYLVLGDPAARLSLA